MATNEGLITSLLASDNAKLRASLVLIDEEGFEDWFEFSGAYNAMSFWIKSINENLRNMSMEQAAQAYNPTKWQIQAAINTTWSEIEVRKSYNGLLPITITGTTNATTFTVSADDASRLRRWVSLWSNRPINSNWSEVPTQQAFVESVSGTTITLMSPWIIGYATGDKLKIWSFSKKVWEAEPLSTVRRSDVIKETNYIQIDERHISFSWFADQNASAIYETREEWLGNIITRTLLTMKRGQCLAMYEGKKIQQATGVYHAWGLAAFTAAENNHYISWAASMQDVLSKLSSIILKVARSGVQQKNVIRECTTSFWQYMSNLPSYTNGLVMMAWEVTYSAINMTCREFIVGGVKIKIAPSSVMDLVHGEAKFARTVPLSHFELYSYMNQWVTANNNKVDFKKGINKALIRNLPKTTSDVDDIAIASNFSFIPNGFGEAIYSSIYIG